MWNFTDPHQEALGVNPASWSRTPVSCMVSPAGLGRLGGLQVEAAGGYSGDEFSGTAAMGLPLGDSGFSIGAGGGWNGTKRLGVAQISTCYIVTGDPIGFMEGLFGPSITVGGGINMEYQDSTESTEETTDFTGIAGFQFSLFPSFALGMNFSDIGGEGVLNTGFSHVFNRNLIVHVNYGDEIWQAGGELTVTPAFKIFAGTDGETLHSGMSYSLNSWTATYGGDFQESSVSHSLGLCRRFP